MSNGTIPVYTVQIPNPLYNSNQLQTLYYSPQIQPQLHNSQHIAPLYDSQQLQPIPNGIHNSNQMMLYYPQPESTGNQTFNIMTVSPQLKPMRYPYYPEICPEEPTFVPAPMSIFSSHETHLPPINYRRKLDHHFEGEPAPPLKSIRTRFLAADACCSLGVAISTLIVSVVLCIVFVVVAAELGFNDSFCNGYV